MRVALVVISSVGVAAILIAGIIYLQRSYLIVRQLAFPFYVGALAAALKVFTLFHVGQFPALEASASWILIFLPAVLALRLIGLYWFEVHLKAHRGIQFPSLLQPVTMGLLYLIAGFITLKVVYPGLDVSPLLTTSAITSLVLGLALQPILGNLFAGVVISLERPFRINDCIKIGDTFGRVVGITWHSTHLRTRDDDELIVPNSRIAGENVLNYYFPYPLHLERIRVGVHYKTPPYRVQRALVDCAAGIENALEKPSPEAFVISFDDSAITYELRVWVDDVMHAPRVASQVRARIWVEFRRRGITIPFPIRTLELAPRSRREPSGDARPPARLFITEGVEAGESAPIGDRPLVVGRSKSCTLSIADAQASKEHCRIEWTPDGYVLTDLESTFGTRVNGAVTKRVVLANLDHVTIGTTSMVFEVDER
ncbi:MAG: mechanosensitive ion channel [Acidobacteria bacterium]|nr:mechanosensitive ion channel [Acidobacteriota bacterium]